MAADNKSISIGLDRHTWAVLERFTEKLEQKPEEWIAQMVRLWLGHPKAEDMANLTRRLRRLEAPVRSWPEMERGMMRACIGKD